MEGPPSDWIVAAGVAASILLAAEVALLASALGWRRSAPRAPATRARAWWLVGAPLGLAILISVPAALLARHGSLAPGLSGAGMPWEQVTDETPLPQSAAAGERAYLNRCAPCHLPGGEGLPPAYPPLVGSSVVLGPVSGHVATVLHGRRPASGAPRGQGVMPAFAGVASDAELAAILTYQRNAWGHRAGLVTPSDVARGRGDETR